MPFSRRVPSRRASLVGAIWSILLLLQRLPWLAAAAAVTGGRASPNDGGGGEGQAGGDESASATGAEGRQQQQLGRRPARVRRFLTRARQTTPVMVTSSTGYNLAINDDEQVYGVASDNGPFVRMRLVAIDAGLVALQAINTGLYLAVNDDGFVIATKSITEDNYLIETLEENLYTTYKWYKHHLFNWYLGINRKGRLPRYRATRHHDSYAAAATEDRTIKQSEMFLVRPILDRLYRYGF